MTADSNPVNKRILITGAAGGMGRVCAQLAAAEGYQLVLADLAGSDVAQLTAAFSKQGIAAVSFSLDVTDNESISELATGLAHRYPVDAVIHTVGVSPHMADWERIVNIDVVGTAQVLEAVRPALKSEGCAVCIASMSAYMCPSNEVLEPALAHPLARDYLDRLRAIPGHPLENPGLAYAFAKKALQRFVQDRARDWAAEGKRLVSISPGMIDTQQGRLEIDAMENFDAMRNRIALARLGTPEDIAHTALFLVSPKAAYITGCDILVDGGFIATLRQEERFVVDTGEST